MTDNSQAAHKAAMKEARRFTTDHAQCSAYHEHMLAHLRPQIEADAREVGLRMATLIVIREAKAPRVNDFDADEALAHAANSILALIEKEPTNAG